MALQRTFVALERLEKVKKDGFNDFTMPQTAIMDYLITETWTARAMIKLFHNQAVTSSLIRSYAKFVLLLFC